VSALDTVAALDEKALRAVVRWQKPAPVFVFRLLTYSATAPAWFAAALALWATLAAGATFVPDQGVFLHAMVVALAGWVLSSFLKKRFRRRRPVLALEGFDSRHRTPKDASFPSGHAASSFGFFFYLAAASHPLAPWVGAWAALVTFSRYFLGVHFPSDLAGGVALGAVCAELVRRIWW
jgi:membrane-associated phospholipid phosphatase